MKVAIQGIHASFHDVAARRFFSGQPFEIVQCASFPLLAKTLREKDADVAVMAIENSIAGSILPNYSLLEKNQFKIIGELYLRIEMNLLALPGQKISDIQFVQSHPMALLQCEEFLLNYPHIQILEGSDTAQSAKDLRAKNRLGYAAIAGRVAAETYDLRILNEGIETNKQNYTRFLVLCRKEDYVRPEGANKASIRFEVAHKPGSLVEVLEILHRHSINMTKLQSVVIPGKPYEYSFHVDIEWKDEAQYEQALAAIKKTALNLIHFGMYAQEQRPNL